MKSHYIKPPSNATQPAKSTPIAAQRMIVFLSHLGFYLILAIGFDFLFLGSIPIPSRIRFFIDLIGVWFVVRFPVPLVVIASVGSVLIQQMERSKPIPILSVVLYAWIWCGYVLVLIRRTNVRQELSLWALERWDSVQHEIAKQAEPQVVTPVHQRNASQRIERIKSIAKLLACVVFATLLLRNQPLAFHVEPWVSWSMANKQVFWPGVTMLVLALCFIVVMHEYLWRMQSPSQAKIYLRSLFIGLQHADFRRISNAIRKRSVIKQDKSTKGRGR